MTNLFLFIASDNNLDIDSQNEIDDIFSAKPGNDYRLIIQTDRYKTYRRSEKESRRTRRIVKLGDHSETFLIEEGSTGDASVLNEFLTWGAKNYPADRTVLILWGHGHGWRGCADDYSSRDSLTLHELNQALSIINQQGQLALLGFDMCQMATLEVLFEMMEESPYVIASQNVEPPDGWHYKELLSEPLGAMYKFGIDTLKYFQAYYEERNLENYTLSFFRTSPVKKLALLMEKLSTLCLTDESLFDEIQHSRVRSLDFKYEKYVDIGAFASVLASHTDNEEAIRLCDEINSLLDEVVLHKVAGSKYNSSRGLSVYFPEDLSDSDIKDYAHISFSQKYPGWNNLLVTLKDRSSVHS